MTSYPDSSVTARPQDITAIYDIVWHASMRISPPVSVSASYTGSRILFRRELVATDSRSAARYSAVLKFEGWEAVYPSDETLFRNFEIHSLPPPSTSHLVPAPLSSPDYISLALNNSSDAIVAGPLQLKFVEEKDDDGYPFLHFQIQASTEILYENGERSQLMVVGWAKRREFDDEFGGVDTCLSADERERLVGTGEIDMDGLRTVWRTGSP